VSAARAHALLLFEARLHEFAANGFWRFSNRWSNG
jgi:hypothetical protein